MKLKRCIKNLISAVFIAYFVASLVFYFRSTSNISNLNNTVEKQSILIKELTEENKEIKEQLNNTKNDMNKLNSEIYKIKN